MPRICMRDFLPKSIVGHNSKSSFVHHALNAIREDIRLSSPVFYSTIGAFIVPPRIQLHAYKECIMWNLCRDINVLLQRTHLGITEWNTIVISVLLHCHQYILVVRVLASSSVIVACTIVSIVTVHYDHR